MPLLDSPSIAGITDYMFVPDDVLDADATIVLGMTLWERPLQKAMELQRDGQAGTLVFSGGYNPKIGDYEALKMRDYWIRGGFPGNKPLVDPRSTNTRENMENSRKLLAERGILRHGARINIISINYHMRRAVETFRDVFGTDVNLGVANYMSKYCHPLGWFDDVQGRELLLGEVQKIRRYFPDRAARLDELLDGGPGGRNVSARGAIERTDG